MFLKRALLQFFEKIIFSCKGCKINLESDEFHSQVNNGNFCLRWKNQKPKWWNFIQSKKAAEHKCERKKQTGCSKIEYLRNKSRIPVGPSFSDKDYVIMKKLEMVTDRKIFIITKSLEQHSDYNNEERNREMIKDESGMVIFGGMLQYNRNDLDNFSTRGRQKKRDVFYLSQSDFDLPKSLKWSHRSLNIFFEQTLKDVEKVYRDFVGFQMSYDELKELCKEA